MKQEWYLLPRQRTELAQRCAELAARAFNLYWAACLFGQRKRSYAAALPSPWLWQDDSPADMDCTELIQSSEQKYQALVKLDRPITARERQRLQVAWRDATPGADSCSGNAVQLGRMPGGYNCKRHGRFLVNVTSQTNKVWSADRLLAKAPAIAPKTESGVVTDLDWPAVEQCLGRAGALMDERNIPRRFKPHQQSYRVLNGDIIPCNSQGVADESTKRAFVARGLCWARYDDDTAAAILWKHTSADYLAKKGTEWHKGDIARVIAKERAIVASQVADYKIRPITTAELSHSKQSAPAQPIVSRPTASRARADRPTKFDPAMLFARYQAEPALCAERRRARASALGISTATLDRLEDGLEAIGLIEIQASPGMPGRVILLGGVINIPAPEVLSAPTRAPMAEAQNMRTERTQNDDRNPQCKGETHPPPEAPRAPAAPPALLDAIGEAFDALPGERANNRTGEVQAWPRTNKRIVTWLEATYPELWPQWERSAKRQIARVRKLRRNTVFNAIRDMPAKALDHAHAQCARTIEKFEQRAKLEPDAAIRASWEKEANKRRGRLAMLGQERAERQQQDATRIQRIGYSLTEQAEMLDLVDQVRMQRLKIGKAAASAACVPPNPASAGASAADSTIANLFARQGRQYNPAEYHQQARLL